MEDVDVLQAALLHDTVEDTNTSTQELQDTFGPRVAGMVAEVGVLVRDMGEMRWNHVGGIR